MTSILDNARVFTGETVLDQHRIVVEGERIVSVEPMGLPTPAGAQVQDLGGATLVPGFIDLQVNGGGGLLFNQAPEVDTIARIGSVHRQFGTTGFLPTLVSTGNTTMERGIEAVEQALQDSLPGVLGIHLEGPYLNTQRRGVHSAAAIRPFESADLSRLCSLKRGRTLVTLAPELIEPDIITSLTSQGVIVAGGHSQADYEQTRRALAAGMSGFTHLFNAMPPLLSREPGMVGAALEDEGSWFGIIADGHHVHPRQSAHRRTQQTNRRCHPGDRCDV